MVPVCLVAAGVASGAGFNWQCHLCSGQNGCQRFGIEAFQEGFRGSRHCTFQGAPGQEGADCGLGLQAGDDAKVRLDQDLVAHEKLRVERVRCRTALRHGAGALRGAI